MAAVKREGSYYFLGFTIICLAAALVYFTLELAAYRKSIPFFLDKIESTSSKIEPVVKEISEVRVYLPDILQEIKQSRALVTPVLSEVTEYRKQIPIILEEVRKTRQQLPMVINEVKETQKQLPVILKSVDKASNAITAAANEINATRLLIPKILDEVEKTRKFIPPTLDRVDNMIANANKAGKEASKGAVSGVLTSIVKSPFTILGSLGEDVLGLSASKNNEITDEDVELIKSIANKLLVADKDDMSQSWLNPESGHRGKVTLVSNDGYDEQECRDILIKVWKEKKLIMDKQVNVCLTEDGVWEKID